MRLNIPVLVETGPSLPLRAAAQPHDHDHAADPGQPLPGPAPAYIEVAGMPISEAEIAREMQHHRAARPQEARADAARALVVQAMVRLEVERLGLTGSITPEGAETHEEAAIRVLLEQEVSVPELDEADCRRYFEANRERMHTPPRAQVRHILLAAPPGDPHVRFRARERGEELIQALKLEPDRFAELARLHSACPSREQGGELGWIEPGETVPEFERQVFRLKPGLAGLTVESRYGHHVVHVDNLQTGQLLAFEDCRDRIATYLEAQVRQNAIHQYLQILAERHAVRGLEELTAQAA
jgi:peptidyl-prolyl cis-trans isomerase C